MLVGCACHELQLSMKRVLPSKRKKWVRASSSSSSTDAATSSSSSAAPAVASAAPAAPAKKRRGAAPVKETDPERYHLKKDLDSEVFKPARALASLFFNKEDAYNALEEAAKKHKSAENKQGTEDPSGG